MKKLPDQEQRLVMALAYVLNRGETLGQYAKDAGRAPDEVVRRTRMLAELLLDLADEQEENVRPLMTPAKPLDVRLATGADVKDVFDTLMLQYAEVGLSTLNKEKVLTKVAMLAHKDGGVIGIIRGPDRIEGTIGLEVGPFWYADDPNLTETWHFVHADHRRSTHARHLIDFACWFADELKLPLFMSIVNAHRLQSKERLYSRRLKRVGGMYLHGKLEVPGLLEAS